MLQYNGYHLASISGASGSKSAKEPHTLTEFLLLFSVFLLDYWDSILEQTICNNIYNKQVLVSSLIGWLFNHLLLKDFGPYGIIFMAVCCYNRCHGNAVNGCWVL
jgi:hypothetical protein